MGGDAVQPPSHGHHDDQGWPGALRRSCCCWPMERVSAGLLKRSSRNGARTFIGVFPRPARCEQAGGEKSGLKVRFTSDDVDRIVASVPGINHISPAAYPGCDGAERSALLYVDRERRVAGVSGHLEAGYRCGSLFQWTGRAAAGRHVCVIGSESKTKLFSGGWAIGETIRLNGVLFTNCGRAEP